VTSKNIFCNVPWYQLHIYQDGELGICCQESSKLYSATESYNIRDMSISDWFNSEPVTKLRTEILGDKKLSVCSTCYTEEETGTSSRRIRENFKSVIFTKDAFDKSFDQSPHNPQFTYSQENNGQALTQPVDIHIDLGNHCNLACKMCGPEASSTIASTQVKWGIASAEQYLKRAWTSDATTWNRVLHELLAIPNLLNIHFMGGETLLTPRFHEFVDFMLANGRTDLNLSFVTNGTKMNKALIKKLANFNRVGIEVSIETTTEHNGYIRQKTDTQQVLSNIDKYIAVCNGTSVTLTIRPAISALSIGSYYTLLQYCIDNKLIIKSLIVERPSFMHVSILPDSVKQQYLLPYLDLLATLEHVSNDSVNESVADKYLESIKMQVNRAIALLQSAQTVGINDLVKFCMQNDIEYGYNALEIYPELADEFAQHGYIIAKS